MYKKKIEQYIEAHKQEMLDDICALCSINSERSAYQEGDPFGEAGIFTGAGYVVESNKEHGEGRSDVIVYDSENGQLALFEVKYSSTLDQMKQSCQKALAQIDEKMYAKEFEDSYDKILCYGIAFFKKRCLVYLKD